MILPSAGKLYLDNLYSLYYSSSYTVYALTFAVFADQQPSAKVSPRINLDLSGNESAFVR